MTAMESILSKLTCLEEPGEAESKVWGVVQAWMQIYMMLYEQVSGLISCAWDGFSGGAMNAISVIVGCTITGFFLGDSNTPMLGVMNIGIVIHELYSNPHEEILPTSHNVLLPGCTYRQRSPSEP
jgi:hypothetical protein